MAPECSASYLSPTQPIGVGSEVLAGLLHSVSVCTSSMISRDAVGAEIKLSTLSWASGL